MTTARDAIANILHDLDSMVLDSKGPAAGTFIKRLLSAPDSVRQELVALLNPWRPASEAPKQGQWCLCAMPDGSMAVAQYSIDWWRNLSCEPLAWLPLPAPPSEAKI